MYNMTFSPIKWTADLLPEDHKYYTFLKKVYRHEFRKNGFRRISTPIFETKDMIEKSGLWENFIMENSEFDMRQNAIIGITRAYLDNELAEEVQPIYFYYVDRFYNKTDFWFELKDIIWAQIMWEDDPILDALSIYINTIVLDKIWLKWQYKISINSTWIEKEKVKYREELINFYESKKNILSEKSRKLLDKNPVLILQSEEEDEKILNENAPKFSEKFLKKHSKEHYKKFKEYLDILGLEYIEDNNLVSWTDVQIRSIWNIKTISSWKIISSWARYEQIATNIWTAKDLPILNFETNVALLIKLLRENNISLKNKDELDLFFVQLGDDAKKVVLPLSIKAKNSWINTAISLWTPSMKEQILKAQKSWAKYMVMVWIMEARNGIFQVRNQEDWTQEEVKKDDLIDYIIDKIWKEKLDFYSPEKDLVVGQK